MTNEDKAEILREIAKLLFAVQEAGDYYGEDEKFVPSIESTLWALSADFERRADELDKAQ